MDGEFTFCQVRDAKENASLTKRSSISVCSDNKQICKKMLCSWTDGDISLPALTTAMSFTRTLQVFPAFFFVYWLAGHSLLSLLDKDIFMADFG